MYQKLFLLATVALAGVAAHPGAQDEVTASNTAVASTFKFSETYPEADIIPTAKPEWLALLKSATNLTQAPVYKAVGDNGPQPQDAGKDPYCDWTFTGCFGKKDLYQCPKGQWALTYDDGPSEFSPKLYDYLDQVNVKATFFMVGGQVVKFPDHALRAYKSGHEIAMHTWSHSYMTTLTNEQIVAELKWNELAIKEVTGVSPKYFRPPYGDIDNRVRDVAAALGFIPVIWNYDTNDWAYASNSNTYKEAWIESNVTEWVKNAEAATVGGVSLEHDLYSKTVDVAIKMLPKLQSVYKLVPVGACNGVEMYKENSNSTNTAVPTATNVLVSSSAVSAASSTSSKSVATVSPVVFNAAAASSASAAASGAATSGAVTSSFVGVTAFGLAATIVAAFALL